MNKENSDDIVTNIFPLANSDDRYFFGEYFGAGKRNFMKVN